MIRVADYIAQRIAEAGIQHVFMVTGGGAMHLNDAFGRRKDLTYVCCHHEQALTMAAESYYRLTNRLAVVNVTTGPGGTNALTGVFGAWTDSLGMLVISGQVKWETLVASTNLPLRQLGDQEVDIVRMVEPITKYAQMITDPQTVRYHLEKALYLATAGRPGPCWLDVPMNVQGAMVDPDTLPGYDPQADAPAYATRAELTALCQTIVARMKQAERPVILAGPGVRLGRVEKAFARLLERWPVPVVTSFNAHDLIAYEHPCQVGQQGTIGDRAGNFAVQNADFLLVLGCRLNIRQLSYNWQSFARHAYKVMVDVDRAEMQKPTVAPDLAVWADLADFLPALVQEVETVPTGSKEGEVNPPQTAWLEWCRERKAKYPVVLPEYWLKNENVNPYCFAQTLFEELTPTDIIVTGDATACITTFQAARIKEGQRLYSNSGCASMGYDLPAAIGAAVAAGGKRVICLAGDGSLQMNVQELQTMAGYRLPIKLFIYNNGGYHSIRQTQRNFFSDNIVGCGPESGVTFPAFERLAYAYNIPYRRCASHAEMRQAIRQTLEADGPQICELIIDMEQPFAPKTSSKRLPDGRMVTAPLEDMAPFLEREDFLSNMLIPAMED